VRYAPRAIGSIPLPPSTRNPILQGLVGVVNNPTGTAYDTFKHLATFSPRQLLVAGKTGTASNQKGQEPNSWFASFAPAYHPKYVVLAVIAEGGYGASAAAPVVARTYNYLAAHPINPVSLPSAGHPPAAPQVNR
jgi:penicillin-binding protein 2